MTAAGWENQIYYGDNLDILRSISPWPAWTSSISTRPSTPPRTTTPSSTKKTARTPPARSAPSRTPGIGSIETKSAYQPMHRPARPRLRRDAGLLHLPGRQRHDGLPHHDGPAPGRTAPRPQTHRLPLPPLRPHRLPLPQAAAGCGVRAEAVSARDHLEANQRPQQRQTPRSGP